MKNMKKLLQKAMVFTLSAAMLVGTPLTASAAELVDLYSISDGTKPVKPDGNPTGTITNTDTNTGFLIENNKVSIVGIALDRQTINAEAGVKETLKATVVLDGKIYAEGDIVNKVDDQDILVAKKGDDITDLVVEAMSDKIHWQLMYIGADGNVRKDVGNPAEKVGIDLTEEKATNRSVVILTPYHGTKAGEEVTVRATIDASYYFDPEKTVTTWDDILNKDETKKDAFYTADAKVSVKECTDKLTWTDGTADDKTKATSDMYVKRTLDLMPNLVRDPATANDTIIWTSSATKIATVSKDGVVTAKKDGTATITAVSEHGAVATREITVGKAVKADVVKISSLSENTVDVYNDVTGKTTNKDLAKSEDSMTLKAVMYAKVSAVTVDGKASGAVVQPDGLPTGEDGKLELPAGAGVAKNVLVENGSSYIDANREKQTVSITDVITWTSNKKTVATVDADGNNATVTLSGVGTAAITAKASSGKSAKTTVKVAATLGSLAIGNVPTTTLYTGQTVNLTAVKTPAAANNDAVTWGVYAADGKTKTKDASIDKKGVLKIANKVVGEEITVTLKTSKSVNTPDGKKVVEATPVKIKIAQSTIDTIEVRDGDEIVAYGGYDSANKKIKGKDAISKTSNINVPLSRKFTASVGGTTKGDVSLLTWKTNNAKVATITGSGANATIKAVGAGKATITVSGVRYDEKTKKASTLSVKFTVQVKQPVTTLTMNKPTVTLAQKDKKDKKGNVTQADQKVSLKVTFGPKNADKNQKKMDSWTIRKNGTVIDTVAAKKGSASLSYTLKQPKAGEVYKITAKSVTGATATSTITIVAPTTAVQIVKKEGNAAVNKKGEELAVGGKLGIKAQINVGTKNDVDWVDAGSKEAKSKNAEDVTYTVNKKGIVTIDKDGNIYAIKSGNVTITAKTPTGKKATLKIKVKK